MVTLHEVRLKQFKALAYNTINAHPKIGPDLKRHLLKRIKYAPSWVPFHIMHELRQQGIIQ